MARLRSLPGTLVDSVLQKHYPDVTFKEVHYVEYYNKLLYIRLVRQEWLDFFYLYESAIDLKHGCNSLTHVLAAHAYLLAHNNFPKAQSLLKSLPADPAIELCMLNLVMLHTAKPPNWKYLVKTCLSALK
jgi:hypothetical protein